MFSVVSPSSKSGAQKWLNPSGQEKEEQNQEGQSRGSFMEGLKRNLTGMMRSGPIKAMSFEEPLFPSKGRKNSNEVTRSKVFELNISPKRIALSFDSPPTIILEYLVPKTGKLYHHKIKIRGLAWDSDANKVLDQVKRRHGMYLGKIADDKLVKLIHILQERIAIEEGRISGSIKPKIELPNKHEYDDDDYNDDFEEYAGQDNEFIEDQEEEQEQEEQNSNQEQEGSGDFEFDARAVFQSNGQADVEEDEDQIEEIDNKKKSDQQKVNSQDQKEKAPKENEEAKKNNFVGDKGGFDFFEDDEFNEEDSYKKITRDNEEEDDDDDQEDMYEQVKKQLETKQKANRPSSATSYKTNLQQQKYAISHYQKQSEKGKDDQDQDGNEEEEDGDRFTNQKKKKSDDQLSKNKFKINEIKVSSDEEGEENDKIEEEVDYSNYDLNKLDPLQVAKHKKIMDKKFEENRKKPGQKGFVYDVRMEFDPEESNDWDKSCKLKTQPEESVDYDFV